MAADKNRFDKMTSLVIDKLEGGYYHPDMLKDGRIKDSRYANSGETMFGIDRKAGGSINTTSAGKDFWGTIDTAGASKNWKWNYKGGALGDSLKLKAANVMYPEYEKNSKNYLTPEAKTIVDSDNRLLFHFIYGTWNGPGWFRKFAQDINKSVASGVKSPDELTNVAIASRTKEGLRPGSTPNSLIAQGGNKIAGFINTLKDYSSAAVDEAKKKPVLTTLVIIGMGVALVMIVKTLKQNK